MNEKSGQPPSKVTDIGRLIKYSELETFAQSAKLLPEFATNAKKKILGAFGQDESVIGKRLTGFIDGFREDLVSVPKIRVSACDVGTP